MPVTKKSSRQKIEEIFGIDEETRFQATQAFFRKRSVEEDGREYCACCKKDVDYKTAIWLHLSCYTNLFGKGELPKHESQGWFPFHPSCAERALKNKGVVKGYA